MSAETLGTAIKTLIEASPFTSKGCRKIWARLRAHDIQTAPRRVNRIMRDLGLLAPHRLVRRAEWLHDDTIMTDRGEDEIWGIDTTQTVTTSEGRAFVFVAVDHCSGEFVGIHAAASASRRGALEPGLSPTGRASRSILAASAPASPKG
jgi:transposase InsO family protein